MYEVFPIIIRLDWKLPKEVGNQMIIKFGFQGQEKEKELFGGEASFFKYRISDNRIGRFFAVDPLAATYLWITTPYAFF